MKIKSKNVQNLRARRIKKLKKGYTGFSQIKNLLDLNKIILTKSKITKDDISAAVNNLKKANEILDELRKDEYTSIERLKI